MKINQVLNCQFKSWYKDFKHLTFTSEIIDPPDEVLQYFLEDGLVLPEGCEDKLARVGLNSDSEDDETDWESGNASSIEAPKFPEFNQKIEACIAKLGGGIFPKLNWSSPKDARWITLNSTLRCTCPKDIYLLIKSSSFLAHDLVEPLMDCEDYDASKKVPIDYFLVLRRWHEINPSYEFRCFVKENKLIGISQRNHSSRFPFLEAEKDEIAQEIKDFYKQHIADKFPDKDVTFDVYREKQGKVWLIDFNPFGEVTDALLFTWSELHEMNPSEASGVKFPIVKIVHDSGIQPHPLQQYGLPIDINHLTTGADANKFIDLMKMQIQREGDSTDDEENARSDEKT